MLLIFRKAMQLPIELITVPKALVRTGYPRQWLKLALFSLLLSGFFSLIIVVARTPGIAELIGDPQFARKSLVLHVDFALVIWFYAFLAVLYLSLLKKVQPLLFSVGLKLVIAGSFFMMIPVFIKSSDPILANYIPVLDHPLFFTGLLLVAGGLSTTFSNSWNFKAEILPKNLPSFFTRSSAFTIRAAGILVIVAILTFVASFIITPASIDRTLFFELGMWGGGHILQFANVLGMVTVWLILLYKITGRDIINSTLNKWLVSILTLPAILSPVLLIQGTTSQLYYAGFTQLMRWFIFPVVTIYLILGIRAIWLHYSRSNKQKNPFRSLYFNGFLVSALLTVTGFVLGAMIRGSSTLIPAHYHASLGGVTVAYMVMVFILMKEYGYQLTTRKSIRLMKLQPLLFGFGQTMFVIGFAIAGMMGMGRKLFGQDQNIYTFEALTGLGLMSLGGLLAMAGGILFIYIVVKSYTNSQNIKHHGK